MSKLNPKKKKNEDKKKSKSTKKKEITTKFKKPKKNLKRKREFGDENPVKKRRLSERNLNKRKNYNEDKIFDDVYGEEAKTMVVKKITVPPLPEEITRGNKPIGERRVSAHLRGIGGLNPFIHKQDKYRLYTNIEKNKRRLAQEGRLWHNRIVGEEGVKTIYTQTMFKTVTVKRGHVNDLAPKIDTRKVSYKGGDFGRGEKWTDYAYICRELDEYPKKQELATDILGYLNSAGAFAPLGEYGPRTQRAIDSFLGITHIAEEARTVSAGKHVRALLRGIAKGDKTFVDIFDDSLNQYFSARFAALSYRRESFQLDEAIDEYDKEFSDDSLDDYVVEDKTNDDETNM